MGLQLSQDALQIAKISNVGIMDVEEVAEIAKEDIIAKLEIAFCKLLAYMKD